VAKQAVIREVKSMALSCDKVGNALLAKFSMMGGPDACVMMPAHIVFWLLEHLPVNQDPNLPRPLPYPEIFHEDWDDMRTPRILSLQCKQFADALRMELELDRTPHLNVLLNRTNVELLRQFLENYRGSLMDLGVF
jgi:hypothetical protein